LVVAALLAVLAAAVPIVAFVIVPQFVRSTGTGVWASPASA